MKKLQDPISADVARAARNLIATHGKDAARIADQRATNAALSGSDGAAGQWQQIAKAIATLQMF
jgi:hypothetical protein